MFKSTRPAILLIVSLYCTECGASDQILSFPKDQNCGTIELCRWDAMQYGFQHVMVPVRTLGKAQGDVRVPEGSVVMLTVHGGTDLSCLASLPDNSIHRLVLRGAEVTGKELALISQFTTLRELHLRECTIADSKSLEIANGSSHLRELAFDSTEIESTNSLCLWASRCPNLERITNWGFFSPDTIAIMRGHPKLNFVNVELGKGLEHALDTLCTLPQLRGLSVRIPEGVESSRLRELRKLRKLVVLNWSGGVADAELLRTLQELPDLQVLRFERSATLSADFPSELPNLSNVTELALNVGQAKCSKSDLHTALLQMPKLSEWPLLDTPAQATLDRLANKPHLRKISITSPLSDQNAESLASILRRSKLKSLSVSNRDQSFPKILAETISKCSELDHLSINTEDLDGMAFGDVESLTNLKSVSLHANKMGNLDWLGRLPELEVVHLECSQDADRSCDFIAASDSLRELSIYGCLANDGLLELVSKSKLSIVELEEGNAVTDAGIDCLLGNENIQSLSIEGYISLAAVKKLAQSASLNSLRVTSHLLSEKDCQHLSNEFPHFQFAKGSVFVGLDGIKRYARSEGSKIEGKSIRELTGSYLSEELQHKVQGQIVLVDFWGSWCGACLSQMPDLIKLQTKYRAEGFTVLAVQFETSDWKAGVDYREKHPMPWPNIEDREKELAKSFGVTSFPSSFLVDRHGIVRAAFFIPEGIDEAIKQLVDKQ